MKADYKTNQGAEFEDPRFLRLVDSRNRDLWDFLKESYRFELEESPEPGFLTYFDGGTVIIEVDVQEISPAAFTHELLHVFLKAKGIELVWDFKRLVEEDPALRELFTTSLRVHIGNCLEHQKMLPLFLARGFAREEFLRDYHRKLVKKSEIKYLLENYYIQGKVPLRSADQFMGSYFAINASANPHFDYSELAGSLQDLDPGLYSAIDNFWREWISFRIGDPKEKYREMLVEFLSELKAWQRKFAE